MPAKTLMIQGTASNVGKSVVAAAFCRILKRRGLRVAPFKAQNMSNNSCVTIEGGEIGRAQAVQAEACGLKPSVFMNPVLLKPESDQKAQVVLMGKPELRLKSIAQTNYQKKCLPIVDEALSTMMKKYDFIVIEGAGSPSEINLKRYDFVNMYVAKKAKAPVVLVGDIDWGGIFAQLIGTYELLDRHEKRHLKAFLINKFRGNKKILDPGIKWIEKMTKKPVLGVLPFVSDFDFDEEDSISHQHNPQLSGLKANALLDGMSGKGRDHRDVAVRPNQLLIDVIWTPRISNFTDFHPLEKDANVALRYLDKPDRHRIPDLIILPGTKSTIEDMKFLKKTGMAESVKKNVRQGSSILGICGGYQMMGRSIQDSGIEAKDSHCEGLNLFPFSTRFQRKKITERVKAFDPRTNTEIDGYEIHMGQTKQLKNYQPFLKIREKNGQSVQRIDGIFAPGRRQDAGDRMGTYVHGLFDNQAFREAFLNRIRTKKGLKLVSSKNRVHHFYDKWADIVEKNINKKMLNRILGIE